MDYAYSYNGDRVPRSLMPIGYSGSSQVPLAARDVDFSGKLLVPTQERLFGVKGVHDRSTHQ